MNKKIIIGFLIGAIIVTVILLIIVILSPRPQISPQQKEVKEEIDVNVENQWDIKIIDGNIYKTFASGKEEILFNKANFQAESIQNFIEAHLSPDREKICFIGQSIVPQWLYAAKSDGSDVRKVGLGKNCVWGQMSEKFAYNNHTTDVSPVDVFVYDFAGGASTNLTEKTQGAPNDIRVYSLPEWQNEDREIKTSFTTLKDQAPKSVLINLATGEIVEQ